MHLQTKKKRQPGMAVYLQFDQVAQIYEEQGSKTNAFQVLI